eukprot:UN1573
MPEERKAFGCIVEVTKAWSGPPGHPGNGYLSLQPGDRIQLTHPEDNGYFAGSKLLTKEAGWFPEDIVQVVKPAPECMPEETSEDSHSEELPDRVPAPDGSLWFAYEDPQSRRLWFWNSSTDECFFAEDPPDGWSVHEDECRRRWWWNENTQVCFWEENSKRNSRAAEKVEAAKE